MRRHWDTVQRTDTSTEEHLHLAFLREEVMAGCWCAVYRTAVPLLV